MRTIIMATAVEIIDGVEFERLLTIEVDPIENLRTVTQCDKQTADWLYSEKHDLLVPAGSHWK